MKKKLKLFLDFDEKVKRIDRNFIEGRPGDLFPHSRATVEKGAMHQRLGRFIPFLDSKMV